MTNTQAHTTPPAGTYGALFKNRNRRKQKAPLLVGKIELNEDQVWHLAEEIRQGRKPVLNCAGWKNKAQGTGEEYLTLMLTVPFNFQAARPAEQGNNPLDFLDS